jgi:methionyl-tRNA formyltransferase
MVDALDEGYIIDVEACEMTDSETSFSLNRKLLTCFEILAARVVEGYLQTRIIFEGQAQGQPSTPYHFKKFPNDGYIDTSLDKAKIDRFIRAMFFPPYIGARLRFPDGREYEVHTVDEYEQYLSQTS